MVRIPGPLRRITDGADKVEVDADSLGGLITALDEQYAGMKERSSTRTARCATSVNLTSTTRMFRFPRWPRDADQVRRRGQHRPGGRRRLVPVAPAKAGASHPCPCVGVGASGSFSLEGRRLG